MNLDPAFDTLEELEKQWEFAFPTEGVARDYAQNVPQESSWYVKKEEGEAPGLWARRLRRQEIRYRMVSPEKRGFFHACQKAWETRDEPTLNRWLGPESPLAAFGRFFRGKDLLPVFQAHLLCALHSPQLEHYLATEPMSPDKCQAIAADTRLPLGLVRDLAAEITGASRRDSLQVESMPVLLVDGQGEGFTATLDLESVSPGNGELYPDPAVALVFRDGAFQQAEENARQYVEKKLRLWAPERDVRWNLRTRTPQQPLPLEVTGPSASATFGLLCARLGAPSR